jgi:hypothetical protein
MRGFTALGRTRTSINEYDVKEEDDSGKPDFELIYRECQRYQQVAQTKCINEIPSPSGSLKLLRREVGLGGLDVIDTENAWAGIQLIRNAELLPRTETNEVFLYKMPPIRFGSALTPFIDRDTIIDIGGLGDARSAKPPSLKEHLSNLLAALCKMQSVNTDIYTKETRLAQEPAPRLKFDCRYSYELRGNHAACDKAATQSELRPYVPVGFQPPYDLSSAKEDAFVGALSGDLKAWHDKNHPSDDGELVFDVTFYATLTSQGPDDVGGRNVPILRLRNLRPALREVDWA